MKHGEIGAEKQRPGRLADRAGPRRALQVVGRAWALLQSTNTIFHSFCHRLGSRQSALSQFYPQG